MKKVLAISGGIGGAKLALGLYSVLDANSLTVAVNTGDDFEHLGLTVCPDLDTTLYTLAGLDNTETGWGRAQESWNCLASLGELGAATWFGLGDKDLAIHILRSEALRNGQTPGQIAQQFCEQLAIRACVRPATNARLRTWVDTTQGELPFQHYFVRERCEPRVSAIRFENGESAAMEPHIERALSAADLGAIIICPSNPYLSIDPILAIPGMVDAIKTTTAPVIAVSPIIAGKAVKGPTAKIMAELGIRADAASVATHYANLIDGFVLDSADAELAETLSIPVHVTNTLMRTLEDKKHLANECLTFAASLDER